MALLVDRFVLGIDPDAREHSSYKLGVRRASISELVYASYCNIADETSWLELQWMKGSYKAQQFMQRYFYYHRWLPILVICFGNVEERLVFEEMPVLPSLSYNVE